MSTAEWNTSVLAGVISDLCVASKISGIPYSATVACSFLDQIMLMLERTDIYGTLARARFHQAHGTDTQRAERVGRLYIGKKHR